MISLKELFSNTKGDGYSDYHISVDAPPIVRYYGKLGAMSPEKLTDEDVLRMLRELMSENQIQMMEQKGEADFACTLEDGSRLRCNAYKERGHYALSLRKLPSVIPTIQSLGTPEALANMIFSRQGLVLVTGPTGSGKSTTLAALINEINHQFSRHIITLEAPIEYIHKNKNSLIHQREVGSDTSSFSEGLRAALRQDPDVILIGEMRDLDTISTAITAAETGHLVFGTLHTNSASETIDRVIDVFPPGQQDEIRAQLANVLECVASQELVPTIDGRREAVFELLVMTPAVRNLIRERKTFQINTVIQGNRKMGMITRDDALYEMYGEQVITAETAESYSIDKANMRKRLMM